MWLLFQILFSPQLIVCYSDQPSNGGTFVDTISLQGVKIESCAPRRGRFSINLKGGAVRKVRLEAATEAEKSLWLAALHTARAFADASEAAIALWPASDVIIPVDFAPRRNLPLVRAIPEPISFWCAPLQDLSGRVVTLEGALEDRSTIVMHIDNYAR